jgi:fatty acid desaturase
LSASTIRELALEFKTKGLTKKTPVRIIVELILHTVNTLAGIAWFVVSDSWIQSIMALLISALGLLGVATNTHTSAHGATSESKWINHALTYFGYPFMLMLSATYWHHKHNIVHHPVPNVIGEDADADLSPYFALTADQYMRASTWRKRWYDIQWLFFPFALAASGFNVQLASWSYLMTHLLDPEKRTAKHWLDLAVMLLHIVAWIIVPSFFFNPVDVVCLYTIRFVLMGYAMFAAFAPAHFPEEAQAAAQNQRNHDYVLIQTVNTINFKTGPIGRFLCSGVDYQIEHHLFPHISHVHYPTIAPMVKEYCEAHGYPYRSLPWWKAIWQSLTVMKNPKPVVKDLTTYRKKPSSTPLL